MITKEKVQSDIITNIANRELEVYGYQLNINNYEAILRNLLCVWCEDLIKFKGMTSEEIVKNVPEKDIQIVSDLVFRDKIETTLKIEKLEQSKAIHVLNALKSQLENYNDVG